MNDRYSLTASKKIQSQQLIRGEGVQQSSVAKVISFVGDMQNNVNKIIAGIKCCRNCEFKQILSIFGSKLQKLRNDRDNVRQKYVEDVMRLESQIKKLEQENGDLRDKLEYFMSQRNGEMSFQSFNPHNNLNNGVLFEKSPPQISAQDFSQIEKMVIKYNISGDDLEQMIKQYLGLEDDLDKESSEILKLQSLCNKLSEERQKSSIRERVTGKHKENQFKFDF